MTKVKLKILLQVAARPLWPFEAPKWFCSGPARISVGGDRPLTFAMSSELRRTLIIEGFPCLMDQWTMTLHDSCQLHGSKLCLLSKLSMRRWTNSCIRLRCLTAVCRFAVGGLQNLFKPRKVITLSSIPCGSWPWKTSCRCTVSLRATKSSRTQADAEDPSPFM